PSFSISPSVELSFAGRGEASKGGSCVLIPDLVVIAKVGALGSRVSLLLIVERIRSIVHAIPYGVGQEYILSLLRDTSF
ncbi:hypothetical protein Tco_0264965, partial [Tanacetum coccineum]